MTNYDQNDVLQNVQQLIDKSRCGIDGFFTDSRTAARDILKYLERENLIINNESAVEIRFNEQSKAA
jgi:hypothetical protein